MISYMKYNNFSHLSTNNRLKGKDGGGVFFRALPFLFKKVKWRGNKKISQNFVYHDTQNCCSFGCHYSQIMIGCVNLCRLCYIIFLSDFSYFHVRFYCCKQSFKQLLHLSTHDYTTLFELK